MLATQNVEQSTLKNNYNSLGNLRIDLNNDGIINDYDNLDPSNAGICQPTAVAMALRYMVLNNTFSYSNHINNDQLDINNVFYEVVEKYIGQGWTGGSASRPLCSSSLNAIFDANNYDYNASYQSSNLLSYILTIQNSQLPSIGHISYGTTGHAVTIVGYETFHITYIDDT